MSKEVKSEMSIFNQDDVRHWWCEMRSYGPMYAWYNVWESSPNDPKCFFDFGFNKGWYQIDFVCKWAGGKDYSPSLNFREHLCDLAIPFIFAVKEIRRDGSSQLQLSETVKEGKLMLVEYFADLLNYDLGIRETVAGVDMGWTGADNASKRIPKALRQRNITKYKWQ